jgi:hypothetical protein
MVRMPPLMYEALAELARRERTTMTHEVLAALRVHLDASTPDKGRNHKR